MSQFRGPTELGACLSDETETQLVSEMYL